MRKVGKETPKRRHAQKRRMVRRYAWHAYINESVAGERADFASLAAAYRGLSAAEKLRLQARAKVSSVPRAHRGKKWRVFKDPQRVNRAKAEAARQAQRWAQSRHLSDAERMDALISAVVSRTDSGGDVERQAGRLARLASAGARQEQRDLEGRVSKFRCDEASSAASSLGPHAASPDLAQAFQDFAPIPLRGAQAWGFAPDIAPKVEGALDLVTRHSHKTNLGGALDLDWSQRIAPVQPPPPPPEGCPAPARGRGRVSRCLELGECCCSEDGKLTHSVYKKVCDQVIKPHTRLMSTERKYLTGGLLVLALLAEAAPADRNWVLDVVPVPDFRSRAPQVRWRHLALTFVPV